MLEFGRLKALCFIYRMIAYTASDGYLKINIYIIAIVFY